MKYFSSGHICVRIPRYDKRNRYLLNLMLVVLNEKSFEKLGQG